MTTIKRSFLILLYSAFVALTSFAHAEWIGKGNVVGKVTKVLSQSDGRVEFVLTIESQMNEIGGPDLGDGNSFAYSGARKESISVGDRLRLRVNSSQNDIINVESLETLSHEPPSIPIPKPNAALGKEEGSRKDPKSPYTVLMIVVASVCCLSLLVFCLTPERRGKVE